MSFADITAVPVPADHRASYLEFSMRMSEVYRDHGAIRVTDYWRADGSAHGADFHADGVAYDGGELRDFASVVGASASEAIVVTVIEWASREARDAGVAAATSDPRVLATLDEDPVFDGARVVADSFTITMHLEP